jgi:sugar lactone lactonase YvrE
MSAKPGATWRVCFAVAITSGLVLVPAATAEVFPENYTFTTLAGPREAFACGYDGTGSEARFQNPFGVAVDGNSNLYVTDTYDHAVRKVAPGGVVTTLAGLTGAAGSTDGSGGSSRFNLPAGVAMDAAGNVYVADSSNQTIRMITPAGLVTTLAGSAGTSGTNDGTGVAARFNTPSGVALDSQGNVYVADTGNHAIRRITPTGEVTTLAGALGTSGSVDGTGGAARFYLPASVAVDAAGNVFVADAANHTIRRISTNAVVTTWAGSAGAAGSANGTGGSARFNGPNGVAVGTNGNVYVADTFNHTIRKITASRAVTTLAGSAGTAGSANGTGTAARFNQPASVAADAAGNVYVADYSNNSLRKVTSAGVVTTLAGMTGGSGALDATANAARFSYPAGTAVDAAGNVYVADFANHTIRKISPAGVVTTFAGLAGTSGSANGTGSSAHFYRPTSVAVDGAGNLYVADSNNHTIRKITPARVVTTLAGSAGKFGSTDGTGTTARFNAPFGVAVDANTNVYVADTWNHTLRKITRAGVVTTLAGTAGSTGSTNGPGNAARFNYPQGVAVDRDANVYVADEGNHTIRKITPDGTVTTLAGSAGESGSADGPGSDARFNLPSGLAVDSSGNLYVGDTWNHTLRKITPDGTVTTLAGSAGRAGSAEGTGSTASFYAPEGLAVDANGRVYVADSDNHAIRIGYPALTDTAVVDLSTAPPGVVRHLDVTHLTTTSWSWSIVRYPAGSSAQLSAPTLRNPTLTPDVSDVYVVRFQGTNASGQVALGTLKLVSGETVPQIEHIGVSGTVLVLTGSGGVPGSPYSLLTSPDLALPLGTWTALPAGRFDASGGFALTNTVDSSVQFYRLRVP